MSNTDFGEAQQVLSTAQNTVKLETPPNNLPVPSQKKESSALSEPKAVPKPRPRSAGIANIVSAIAAVTSEVGIVGKDGYNQFHRYKYVKMEDVLQHLTPLLAKHGIVIFQSEVERTFVDDGRAVAVAYEFTPAHITGESWHAQRKTGLCRAKDSKGGFDDKSFNKCSTAARKYYLLELFQIATDELPDADSQPNTDTPTRAPTKVAPRAGARIETTPGADTESRLDDGTRYDARTGEVIPDDGIPAELRRAPGDEKGKAGAAATAPAEPKKNNEGYEAADFQLGEAAKHGMKMLETAWYALDEDTRKICKVALESRHKKTAMAFDQAERMKTGDFTNG